ncbi:MAG: response regulator [Erysipelotrichia bacterium]|jgi:two-component system response regulator YesN|nr:response regulator [Erysipelotrichia bacterium]
MKQYTIMLVEDEEDIRSRIFSKIEPNQDFKVIAQANNGYDAFELFEKMIPDVLITDIKMPFVDGLTLAQSVKLLYPKTKIVFITGFNEFDYAKKAIELGVIDYLSKPISLVDIEQVLNKLKQRLDDDERNLFNEEKLKEVYQSQLPALIDYQFNDILRKRVITQQEIDRFSLYGYDFNTGYFTCGLIQIEGEAPLLVIEQTRTFLFNAIKKQFSNCIHALVFNSVYGLGFCLHHEQITMNDMMSKCAEIVDLKSGISNIVVKIALSASFDQFAKFNIHFNQTIETMKRFDSFNFDCIGQYDDFEVEPASMELNSMWFDHFEAMMRLKSISEIDDFLSTQLEDERDVRITDRKLLIKLASMCLDYAEFLHVNLDEIIGLDILERLASFRKMSSLWHYIRELIINIRDRSTLNQQSKSLEIFKNIESMMKSSYHDPNFSMEMVCEALNISTSYLTSLYKRYSSTSFNKCLVKHRIDKASELLMNTPLKIYEIAEKVGYNDVYYFSHSFKKQTGLTPKEFRHE